MPVQYGGPSIQIPGRGDSRPNTNAGKPSNSTPIQPPGQTPLNSDGLIVILSKIPGVTAEKVLDSPFYFQCPPTDTVAPSYSWTWNDFPTLADGYHSAPNYANLMTLSFTSMLVDQYEVWGGGRIIGPSYALTNLATPVLGGLADVIDVVNFFKELGNSLTPFAIQWGQPALWGRWDSMIACTMRSFVPEERPGEPDARYFTLTVSQYMDAGPLVAAPPPVPPGGMATHRGPYTTSSGQKIMWSLDSSALPAGTTLASLAKIHYKSASLWRLIAAATGIFDQPPNADLRSTWGAQVPPVRIIVPEIPGSGQASGQRPGPTLAYSGRT